MVYHDSHVSEVPCLDHGFVRLVDVMGNDSSIVQAARTSYGKGTKTKREDAGLIRYLMSHKHTTPFEMVEYKFHIKCPIFVARQWLRHRTASVNEYSLRYSEAHDQFYVPQMTKLGTQDNVNKQGTIYGGLDYNEANEIVNSMNNVAYHSYDAYKGYIEQGVSREQARIVLPLSNYTEFYWKMDLHNLLHFLELRMDSHAQYEIRVFAEAIAQFVKQNNPLAWQAFEEYVLGAVTFSKSEMERLRHIISVSSNKTGQWVGYLDTFDYFGDEPSDKTIERRRDELRAKLFS